MSPEREAVTLRCGVAWWKSHFTSYFIYDGKRFDVVPNSAGKARRDGTIILVVRMMLVRLMTSSSISGVVAGLFYYVWSRYLPTYWVAWWSLRERQWITLRQWMMGANFGDIRFWSRDMRFASVMYLQDDGSQGREWMAFRLTRLIFHLGLITGR